MRYSQGMGPTRPTGIDPYAEQNSPLRPHRVRRCPLFEHKTLENRNMPKYVHDVRAADSTRPKGLRQLPGNRSDTRRTS